MTFIDPIETPRPENELLWRGTSSSDWYWKYKGALHLNGSFILIYLISWNKKFL